MSESNHDDLMRWKEVQDGSIEALSAIFSRYQALLLKIAYLKLGDFNSAQDITQDVFLDFWRKRNSINIETSVKAYLTTSVFRTAANYKRKHHRIVITDPGEHSTDVMVIQEPIEHKDMRYQLHKVIQQIPKPACRQAIELRVIKDLSIAEIAVQTNTNQQVVRNRLSLGLKYLKTHAQNLLT